VNKREQVKGLYPKSKNWAHRVNKMSDAQVAAIWARSQNTKKNEGDKK
jgi:hypothetical protein